jgi:hypothetical protein
MERLKSRELRGVVESKNVRYSKERRVQCKYILISQKHKGGEKNGWKRSGQ